MQIVIGKCISGELIVGKLEEKNNNLIIANAYLIIVHPDFKTNQFNSIIVPMLLPFDDKAIKEISMDKIIAVIEAPNEIQHAYIKLLTGLDVISSGTKIVQ